MNNNHKTGQNGWAENKKGKLLELFLGRKVGFFHFFEVIIQMGFPMHTIIETRFEFLITLTALDDFFTHNSKR
jgi:hypothetical protein